MEAMAYHNSYQLYFDRGKLVEKKPKMMQQLIKKEISKNLRKMRLTDLWLAYLLTKLTLSSEEGWREDCC
jgi:hypothetical protein